MTVTPPTQDQIDSVKPWLPVDYVDNGWDDTVITDRWTGHISTTVRKYWFMRVSDTAGYLDLPDPGGTLPITQIHRQAREMLDYWDLMIKLYGAAADPDNYGSRPTRVGAIKNRYPQKRRTLDYNTYRSPYTRVE